MNLLPAVLFGGPPHAGKSVLFYSLARALRERGVPHHAFRACPDGEGNWFHELDQEKVRLIRVKGAWTDGFVKRICQDLERRHLPLLVDAGGRPTQQQNCILRNCTHSLLLLRPEQQDTAAFWRHLAKVNGLLPLAELSSQLEGDTHLDTDGPVITGTITGLERGSVAQGPLFEALVDRVALLFTSYSLEELEQVKLDLAPVELVTNLESLLQAWMPGTTRWKPAILPRLLAELPAETPLAIYGPGPNWVYGALAAHAGQQPFYQFDPRIGWVTPPLLQVSTQTTPDIQVQLRITEQVTVLSLHIGDDHLDYLQAEHLPVPPIALNKGLIVDGRIPHWLLTAIVRVYWQAGVTWIACHQVQLEGAVVVTSRTTDHTPGDFVTLPVPLDNHMQL
jgi:CRISPR-associated protein Csx3